MQKAIATQAGLADLKYVLDQISENLKAHVNESLSRAHGIEIIPGYVDSYGNDLTTYQNSHGDVVGRYILRFQIKGQLYYAPAQTTALPGNPEATGAITTAGDDLFTGTGQSAWITDYTTNQVTQAETINDLLVQHTQLSHNETHKSSPTMSALAIVTYDSNGYIVGTQVVQISVGNSVYNIPADTRFGGPVQGPRILTNPVAVFDSFAGPGDGQPTTTLSASVAGSKPIAFQWQISIENPNDYENVIPGNVYASGEGFRVVIPTLVSPTPPSGTGSSTSLFLDLQSGDVTGNKVEFGSFYFRCVFTNSGGTTITTATQINMQDQTASCVLFTAAFDLGVIGPSDLIDMLRYRLRIQKDDLMSDRIWTGYMVGFAWLTRMFRKHEAIRAPVRAALLVPLLDFVRWRTGRGPFKPWTSLIYGIASSYCLAAWAFNRKKAAELGKRFQGRSLMSLYRARLKKRAEHRTE